jgi:hypothetical protein
MWKKVLIGCGVIVLLCVILFITCSVVLVKGVKGMAESAQRIAEKYESTNSRFAFAPRDDQALTEAQLDRWLAVRDRMMPYANTFVSDLESEFEKNPIGAIKNMFKQAENFAIEHTKAMEIQEMSSDEYRWITEQALAVLSSEEAAANQDMAPLMTEYNAVNSELQREQQIDLGYMSGYMTPEQIQAAIPMLLQRQEPLTQTMRMFVADHFILDFASNVGFDYARADRPPAPGAEPVLLPEAA